VELRIDKGRGVVWFRVRRGESSCYEVGVFDQRRRMLGLFDGTRIENVGFADALDRVIDAVQESLGEYRESVVIAESN
jgi:hypothetical protein